MNLARSTFYSPPMGQRLKDAQIVEKIAEICVEYPRYGYRRATAQLHRERLKPYISRTTRHSPTSSLTFRTSSTRFATCAGSTPRSDTGALSSFEDQHARQPGKSPT
jgi:hypothetical protein